jgi:hypothetical protein
MKFVPRLLTTEPKQRRINACLELEEKANEDPTFISRIITGNESWRNKGMVVAEEEPTITKSQKGATGLEFIKELAHCFLYLKGSVHREFVPPNTTVDSDSVTL